jgi:hypothetical protein
MDVIGKEHLAALVRLGLQELHAYFDKPVYAFAGCVKKTHKCKCKRPSKAIRRLHKSQVK